MNTHLTISFTMKTFAILSFFLSVIAIICIFYNLSEYLFIDQWLEKPQEQAVWVFYNTIYLFGVHLLVFFTILKMFSISHNFRSLGSIVLVLASLSFIGVFLDWGALTDIVKDAPAGYDVRFELRWLFIGSGFHLTFFLGFLAILFKMRPSLTRNEPITSISFGEHIFLAMNVVGIVCALVGLLATWWEFRLNISPSSRKWAVLPQMIVILLPYLLVSLSWLLRVIRNTKTGFYDEKQQRDVTKAGITTWLISIPAMVILFLWSYQNISGPISILWLPFYIFMTIFTFSLCSLYYFKKA